MFWYFDFGEILVSVVKKIFIYVRWVFVREVYFGN